MSDAHGVARDQLRAFIERIERLEEEKKTIADDIKDVYGEAKGMGFDTVIMKRVIALRKKDEQQRQEEEAILDTYLHALGMIDQPDFFYETPAETKTSVGSGRGSAAPLRMQPETATETHQRPSINDEPSPGAGPQAEASPAGTGAGTLADREGRFDGEADSSDLPTNSEIDPNEDRSEGQSLGGGLNAVGANTGGDDVDGSAVRADTSNTAGGTVSNPPADGITYETAPKVGMKYLSYAHCFPELTKAEYQCLAGDITLNGVQEPIVRMGDIIVYGWNRYNAARSLGVEYPVREYDGDDVLLDVIRWQRAARNWTPQQERKIATSLSKAVPHRSNDIWQAFDQEPALQKEEVAA